MTILDAIRDPHLFGAMPALADLSTWRSWLVFLAAVYGLPLPAGGLDLFCRHTGRTSYRPPLGGFPEVVCITGRQSGKSRVAGLIADFEAIHTAREADRTELYALLIAQDQRAAIRALFSYAVAPFQTGMLAQAVSRQTADTLTLTNGITIAAYPCRPQAVRGLRARVVVADELAFYLSSEGFPRDTEMLRSLRPALATTGGKLIILSSPYGASGALHDLHRQHYGRCDSTTLIWQASAPEMNPTLPADYLARMERDDPEAYRSEVLGEFRAGLSTLLDPDVLDGCIVRGRHELPRVDGVAYVAFVDASGGRRDDFTAAIAHHTGDRAVLDCVRAWHPPFNPRGVVEECSGLLRSYGVSEVCGDRYGAEWVAEAFRSCQLSYSASPRDRSAIYLELLPQINSGAVELLDDGKLLRQLRMLERRRGTAGKDRVDHPRGQHDDVANAAAGALVLAAERARTVSHAMPISVGVRRSPFAALTQPAGW